MLMTQVQDEVAAPAIRAAYRHIEVTQVGGVIGAVVGGIRAGGDVGPAAVAELRAALLAHKVVFLRDQQHATDGLRAVHSNLYDYAADRPQFGGVDVKEEAYRAEFRHLEFETEHPVVRIHPETSEPALLLGHFVRSFTGLSGTDSAELFALLQRHITRLENTVRWTWRDGDIAIWDNRATQHYGVADYDDHPRLLHRITIAGDVPVGINGDTSVVRKGDASRYSRLAA